MAQYLGDMEDKIRQLEADLEETRRRKEATRRARTAMEDYNRFLEEDIARITESPGFRRKLDVIKVSMEKAPKVTVEEGITRITLNERAAMEKHKKAMENVAWENKVKASEIVAELEEVSKAMESGFWDKRGAIQAEIDPLLTKCRQMMAEVNRVGGNMLRASDPKDMEMNASAFEQFARNPIKDLESVLEALKAVKRAHAMMPEKRLARALKAQAHMVKKKAEEGPDIYKIPAKMTREEPPHNFRFFEMGTSHPTKKVSKVVVMLGMTGSGKSLLINNIVNYMYGVSYEDDFRFQLIVEQEEIKERSRDERNQSTATSMTRWISCYTLHYMEGCRVPYPLILIDTPGFGDGTGMAHDEAMMLNLREFFTNKEYPIHEISAACMVIQASQSRLTAEQKYIFNSVLNIFGKNVAKNISLLFTFADAQSPPALETVKKEEVPYDKNAVFKFNSSSVYAKKTGAKSNWFFWDFGYDNLEAFFKHIKSVEPMSLALTTEVLTERGRLQSVLEVIHKDINYGIDMLQNLENTIKEIIGLQGSMEDNKGYKIKEKVKRLTDHNVNNCVRVVCPSAQSGDRVYEYPELEIEETVEEMMDRYNIAAGDKTAKVELCQRLLDEYARHKARVFGYIEEACRTANRLEQIALGKSIMTSVTYIDNLIYFEERDDKANKTARLEQLREFRRMAETLHHHAESDPGKLRGNDFERKVMDQLHLFMQDLEEQGAGVPPGSHGDPIPAMGFSVLKWITKLPETLKPYVS